MKKKIIDVNNLSEETIENLKTLISNNYVYVDQVYYGSKWHSTFDNLGSLIFDQSTNMFETDNFSFFQAMLCFDKDNIEYFYYDPSYPSGTRSHDVNKISIVIEPK